MTTIIVLQIPTRMQRWGGHGGSDWVARFLLLFLLSAWTQQPHYYWVCHAAPLLPELSDPALQPKFQVRAPNPLDPNFRYDTESGYIEVGAGPGLARTGLVGKDGVTKLYTPIWGYGSSRDGYTWPGRTFVVQRDEPLLVKWINEIPIENGYLLTGIGPNAGRSVVDTTLHWAYGQHLVDVRGDYNNMDHNYTIEQHGTPIVVHLHGGHTDSAYDGQSEAFFSPNFAVKGRNWVDEVYVYENIVPANNLWYHDHTLGITRLNVYTGLSGLYFIRDQIDTGLPGNPLSLPTFPYEIPLLIQDRMFKKNGELFYPAFPGDPTYEDYIGGEGAQLPPNRFPNGGPTALAEFFGDHMLVNGKIWPKFNVEPRTYRLRLVNGCDSRFIIVEFRAVELGQVTIPDQSTSTNLVEFLLIGGGQGLAERTERKTRVILAPSDRLDIIIDFSNYRGKRIIQANLGGDSPFGGVIPGEQVFSDTDKIVAFDVTVPLDTDVADNYQPKYLRRWPPNDDTIIPDRVRRLGLFEGKDEFGRLQPLLGTVEPATDKDGNPIYWPNTPPYVAAGLAGLQMSGTMTWSDPITEHVNYNDVEEWEIFNLSADAHPIHLHLVAFEVLERRRIVFDSAADADGILAEGVAPAGNGTYVRSRMNVLHDGSLGSGYTVFNATIGERVTVSSEYTDDVPTDTVVTLPGQVVRIRATFNRMGLYVWHCHLLSHEDHEMMREYYVGEFPTPGPMPTAHPPAPAPSAPRTCAELKRCSLVDLDTNDEMVLTGDDSYEIVADQRHSIRCDADGPIGRFRFSFNGKTVRRTHFAQLGRNDNRFRYKGRSISADYGFDSSFWLAGDTGNGQVNAVPYLKKCGTKFLTVSATNFQSEICFTEVFKLYADCGGSVV